MKFTYDKNQFVINDNRNKNISKHTNHNVKIIIDKGYALTGLPWVSVGYKKMYCLDCGEFFDFYDYDISEKERDERLKGQINED